MPPLTETLMADAGLFAIRLVFGPYLFAHGAQKLFGWFHGMGFQAASKMLDTFGFRPAGLFVRVAALTEMTAAVLITLGLLGPVGPALMVSVMIVACVSVWRNGLFAVTGGAELSVLYGTVGVGLALVGPGRASLDFVLGLDTLWTPGIAGMVLAIGVLGGLGNLATRRKPG